MWSAKTVREMLQLAASSGKCFDECGVVADIFESGHVFLGQVLLNLVSFFCTIQV
jgi:hypothetical protein